MTLWLATRPLILASTSSARRALLEAAGVPVEVHQANIDERALEASARPAAASTIAPLLAHEKAFAVARSNPGRLVLGADQTLTLGTRRFVKPVDRAAARAHLRALSGRQHELHSAVVFVQDAKVQFEHIGNASLTMRSLSDRFLELYLDAVGTAATTSVGGYQLELLGVQLFERIDGDYFSILGLPLMQVLDFLRCRGYLLQ